MQQLVTRSFAISFIIGGLKMKTTRIVALMIVCAIIFSLAAVNAFAKGVIDTVTIDELTEPVIGWEPVYSYKIADNSGFDAVTPGPGCLWLESIDGNEFTKMATNYEVPADKPIFKSGYYYRFEVELKCNDSNIWENPMKSVTVNGKKAELVREKDETLVKVYIDYGPLDYDKVVSYIAVGSVEEPVIGKAPSYNFVLKGSDASEALPGPGCFWYESTDGGLTYKLLSPYDETVKFKDGGIYRFYTEASAAAGYKLSGQVMATVNDKAANVDTTQFATGPDPRIAQISYFYGPLGTDSMSIMVVGDENLFSTYKADTVTKASVIIMNTKESVDVKWFECDGAGKKLSEKPIGNDLDAFLPGIPAYDMMYSHYILIVATETTGAKRSTSLVVPYILYPMGYEEDPGEKINVTLKGGITDIVVTNPNEATYVEVEITNEASPCSVDWFPCDDAGNPDWAHPILNGYNITLPGIDAKDAGKVFKYCVHAEDDRGGAYAGDLIFTYTLKQESGETTDPADATEGPTDATADPEATPGIPDGSNAPQGSSKPETTPDPDGSSAAHANVIPLVLLIVLGVIMALLLCALCVLIGVLLGKKKSEK